MSATGIYKRCMWWDSLTNWPNGNTAGAEEKCIERALGMRSSTANNPDGGVPDLRNIDVSAGGSVPLDTRRVVQDPTNFGGGRMSSYRSVPELEVIEDGESKEDDNTSTNGSGRSWLVTVVVLAIAYFILFR